MRSSVATGLAHLLAFWYLYSQYDGHAIARLPFEPFSFIRQLSHRNVPGDDYRERAGRWRAAARPRRPEAGEAPSPGPTLARGGTQVRRRLLLHALLHLHTPNLQKALGVAPANGAGPGSFSQLHAQLAEKMGVQ